MKLPDDVKTTIALFRAKKGDPPKAPAGADPEPYTELARVWTHALCEQLRFSHGATWGHKSAGPGRPHSADVIACIAPYLDENFIATQINIGFAEAYGRKPTPDEFAYWHDKMTTPDVFSDLKTRVGWNPYWQARLENPGSASADPSLAGDATVVVPGGWPEVKPMIGFDLWTSVGSVEQEFVEDPDSIDLAGQIFEEVAAVDHLDGATDPVDPPVPPSTSCQFTATDLSEVYARLDAINLRIDELLTKAEFNAAVQSLEDKLNAALPQILTALKAAVCKIPFKW